MNSISRFLVLAFATALVGTGSTIVVSKLIRAQSPAPVARETPASDPVDVALSRESLDILAQAKGDSSSRDRESQWLRELNLSADQMQKIAAIRRRYRDRIDQNRNRMKQEMSSFHQLMSSDASADEVRQRYNQIKALRQETGDLRFESLLETREVLTVEQRRKFAEQMQQQRKQFRDRSERRSQMPN